MYIEHANIQCESEKSVQKSERILIRVIHARMRASKRESRLRPRTRTKRVLSNSHDYITARHDFHRLSR